MVARFIAGTAWLALGSYIWLQGVEVMRALGMIVKAALALALAGPLQAQAVRTIDPTSAAQSDAMPLPGERGTALAPPAPDRSSPADPRPGIDASDAPASVESVATPAANAKAPPASTLATQATPTYRRDDLIGAAEGVFGKGAKGLGDIIERILRDQGEPNAYIAGREVAGAFVVGLRYGSGTLAHKVEGERPVYWTGPSIGFDVGGDATKTFTLVYNLYDSQDLYRRYPQVEGRAYFVGGFSATYLRRGSVVLIPVRLGVGVRLGANVGYLKFTDKSRALPF